MNGELERIAAAARAHATASAEDIQYASNRLETIRLSRLAAEADRVATDMEALAARFKLTAAYFSMSPEDLTA